MMKNLELKMFLKEAKEKGIEIPEDLNCLCLDDEGEVNFYSDRKNTITCFFDCDDYIEVATDMCPLGPEKERAILRKIDYDKLDNLMAHAAAEYIDDLIFEATLDENYDYADEMREAAEKYLFYVNKRKYSDLSKFTPDELMEELLNDQEFIEFVTGNNSGKYAPDEETAEKWVKANENLLIDAFLNCNFDDEDVEENKHSYIWKDVTIRFYLFTNGFVCDLVDDLYRK